ncbi:MAG: NADPH-dependent F420 reductase [Rhodospirillales bacterium]|nr:NADPH-dependent F420 reductase [Rhodospirillales bacterium]
MAKDKIVNWSRRDFVRLAAGSTASLALVSSPLAALAQVTGVPVKIGTLGAGRIGGTLGRQWVKAGHPVMFSSRHPENLKAMVDELGPLARAGTLADAITFADVVLLAVPYHAMPQVAKDHGKALAAKALVLDATNPFETRDGEVGARARKKGVGVAAAELLPGVRLVRAFNAIGYATMGEAHKRPAGERFGMPMAGDDAKALELASKLVHEIGYEPVVIGPMKTMGNHLLPGTALAGERSPDEIRQIVKTLK